MTSAIPSQQKNAFVVAENSGQEILQQVPRKEAASFSARQVYGRPAKLKALDYGHASILS